MYIVDQLISLLAAGLTALLLLVAHLLPAVAPQQQAPVPAQTPAQSTTHFPTAAVTTTTTKVVQKTVVAQPVPQAPPAQQTPLKSQVQINDETRAALVNILCTTQSGGYLAPISASGVIIDSRGVILTNAHVGQFFLLRDYRQPGNVQCVVRMGSPAEPYYTATLLYLPPQWVADNAQELVAAQATGSGENDYAFLLITGTVGTRVMPTSFPAVVLASSPPSLGDPVLLAAYPAGYLGGETITKSLYQSSAVTDVSQLLNFTEGRQIDLFSIGGTVVSQAGSSGGAVVSLYNGALKGIIAVETVAESTGDRDLRAITLDYIDRSLADMGQGGLIPLLSGNLQLKATAFNRDVAPGETKLLEAALDKGN